MHKCTLQQGRFRATYQYYDDGTPDAIRLEEVFDEGGRSFCVLLTEFCGITDLADVIRRLDRLVSQVSDKGQRGDGGRRADTDEHLPPF